MTNRELYGDLPKLSTVLRRRRLQLAGHCLRATEQPVSSLVLWCPPDGTAKRGRRALTYPDLLSQDVGLDTTEISTLVRDKGLWNKHLRAVAPIPSKDDQ